MEKRNTQIFLGIFVATALVVAWVWYETAPQSEPKTPPGKVIIEIVPTKMEPPALPKIPTPPAPPAPPKPKAPIPENIDTDMGAPAYKPDHQISKIVMPDIAPDTKSYSPMSDDKQISAAIVTSGDEYFRILDAAVSLFKKIF